MNSSKYNVLSASEMDAAKGGRKFWGTEQTTGDWKSIVGNYSQQQVTTTSYHFWIETGSSTSYNSDGID